MAPSKDVKKVVLAYSGGLDTSIILKWLQTELGAEHREDEIADEFFADVLDEDLV